MTTPPRTPTTATLGHRDVCTVDVPAAWHEKWPCLPDERHTFPPSATHCFCGALRRPPVDVVEVTLFTPAEARAFTGHNHDASGAPTYPSLDVERLARALAEARRWIAPEWATTAEMAEAIAREYAKEPQP